MTTVVLVIHLLIAIALVGLILLQRSEGGALGIGGGAGGGFMTPRSAGNLLTKMTGILAVAFMATSITLALLAKARIEDRPGDILDVPAEESTMPEAAPAPVGPVSLPDDAPAPAATAEESPVALPEADTAPASDTITP